MTRNDSIPSSDKHAQPSDARAPYGRFTARMALQLAAPHTWPAAILPCLVATAAAAVTAPVISVSLTIVLLAICILMQSAVNTFNDYYDYVKGADSADDNVDPADATLIYNNVNPKSALALAVGFLIVAFILGVYPVLVAGWIPLAIALIGAAMTVLYSAGKTPVSYLPIGECVSGLVMGGLIPLACYQVLTGSFELLVLVWAFPEIIGVGLIMMTNNTCDIEKDIDSGRKTLPALLGRPRARKLYRVLLALWLLGIAGNVIAFFQGGAVVLPFTLLAAWPLLKALTANPLAQATRQAAMSQICSLNIALGAFYAAAILADGTISLAL